MSIRLQAAGGFDLTTRFLNAEHSAVLPDVELISIELVGSSDARFRVSRPVFNDKAEENCSLVVFVKTMCSNEAQYMAHSCSMADVLMFCHEHDDDVVELEFPLDYGFDCGRVGLFRVALAVLDGGWKRKGSAEVCWWPVFCHDAEGVVGGCGGSDAAALCAHFVSTIYSISSS